MLSSRELALFAQSVGEIQAHRYSQNNGDIGDKKLSLVVLWEKLAKN